MNDCPPPRRHFAAIGSSAETEIFSAKMNAAFRRNGLDCECVPMTVRKEYLQKFLLKAHGFLSGILMLPMAEGQIREERAVVLSEQVGATEAARPRVDWIETELQIDGVEPSQLCEDVYKIWIGE